MDNSEKISVMEYGVAVMPRGWVGMLQSPRVDRMMKEAPGFLGYDDVDGVRFYFYMTPEQEEAAAAPLRHDQAVRGVMHLREPVMFNLVEGRVDGYAE